MPTLLAPLKSGSGIEYRQNYGYELLHWNSKLAGVKNGTGTARILIIGDSVFEGAGPTSIVNRPIYKFTQNIQKIWRPGGEGYVPAVIGGGITPARWTNVNSSDLTDYGFGLGRHAYWLNTATASSTITFSGDRFQLWYTRSVTAGNMKVVVDGGAPILFSTNGTGKASNIWDSFTNGGLTLTRGSHTVVVSADNTDGAHAVYNAVIDGIMIFDADYANGIQVVNASRSGYAAYGTYDRTSSTTEFWASGMANVAPDLVIIELGLNDLGANVGAATFKTALAGVITNVLQQGMLNTPLSYTPSFALVPLWGRANQVTATTGVTNGTTTFTDTTANQFTSGLAALDWQGRGATITGTNIPANTYVVGYTSAGSITMSNAATGSGASTYTITYRDEQWTAYRNAMYELARDNGYAVWDMYNQLGRYIGTDPNSITTDRLHPNDVGAQMIATALTRQFTDVPDQFWVSRGDINAAGQRFFGTADNSYITVLPFDYWGDGSDGAWTPDGSTTQAWATRSGSVHTLTRDTNLTSLIVNSGITIITNGFRLMGNGICTVNSGGIIHNDGGAGGAGSSTVAGGGGGAVGPGSTTASGSGGGGGAAASNAAGTLGSSVTNSLGANGGAGGRGTGTGVVGAAGTATVPVAARGNLRNPFALFGNMSIGPTPTAFTPGAGGGGGAGNLVGAGGGGGSGGGILIVSFPVVTNAGTIRANGGKGGDGFNAGSIGGGGGGGGGGANLIFSGSFTNTGTWTATGGAVGLGSSGVVPAAGSTGTTLWIKVA